MSGRELIFKNGDNYENWKMKMAGIWAGKDMFGLTEQFAQWKVENSIKVKKMSGDEQVELYDSEQRQGLYILYKYLDGDVLGKIQEEKTVIGAIKKLDGIYLKKGGINIILDMHRLVNIRMKNGDVEQYIIDFEEVFRNLKAHGHKMDPKEQAMFMLCNVPESWTQFRNQIFTLLGYDKMEPEVIKDHLREQGVGNKLNKEIKKEKEEKVIESGQEKAMMAREEKMERRRRNDGGEVVCEECGKVGHTRGAHRQCYHCREYGHIATGCLKKLLEKEKKKKVKEFGTLGMDEVDGYIKEYAC
jgi:hypothetical protein